MKQRIVFTTILLSLATIMCATERHMSLDEYRRGERLEQCLINDCTIYTATVRAVGPVQEPAAPSEAARQPLTLAVDDSLRGARTPGQEVTLDHVAIPEEARTALGPWLAWEGITPHEGQRLLIAEHSAEAVARRRVPAIGLPLVVRATDLGAVSAVRRILELHDRFESDAAAVLDLPSLLEQEQSPMVSGALVAYLTQRQTQRDPETTARLAAALVGSEALPQTVRNRMADAVNADFYRLSAAARREVAAKLAVVAASDDLERARPALAVLTRQADDRLLDVQFDPPTRGNLLRSYQALLAAGRIAPSPRFEEQVRGKEVR